MLGTWIQFVAMSWLVYRLTGSALMLGLLGFINQIPILILGPIAGLVTDRVNRRRLLLCTQSLALLQALVLACLAFFGDIQVWQVIALAGLLGVVNAFDVPARQSFIVQMVGGRQDLPNAIALNSLTMNATRLVGPAIGGMLVVAVGEATCFLINAVSFSAILFALSRIQIVDTPSAKKSYHALSELRIGFRYAFGFAPIRMLLLELFVISFLAMPYTTLMPAFVAERFAGNAQTFGLFIGCAGFGAIIATMYLASRRNVQGLGTSIALAAVICGSALVLFSQSHTLWLSQFLMIFVGFGVICHAASINTILQTIVDEDKRGRVMSFYTMCFVGTAPLGNLFLGQIAQRFGVATTFLMAGVGCAVAGIIFALRLATLRQKIAGLPSLRGIIP